MQIPLPWNVVILTVAAIILLLTYTFCIWYSTSLRWAEHVLKDHLSDSIPPDTATLTESTPTFIKLPDLPKLSSILPSSFATVPTIQEEAEGEGEDKDPHPDAHARISINEIPMFTPLDNLRRR